MLLVTYTYNSVTKTFLQILRVMNFNYAIVKRRDKVLS